MPNRIIKESICTSDTIEQLSWFEEVTFYRLIVSADDYGRMDARPAILKGRLFPLKDVTAKQVEAAVIRLSTVGIVKLYEVEGRPYLQLCTWANHQRIRKSKEKYPAPIDTSPQLAASCGELPPHARVFENPIQSESESNPIQECSAHAPRQFQKPSVEEVADYCRERSNRVDPQRFVDYYTSNGWKVGRNAMKDWKAAVRTWERTGGGAKNGADERDARPALPNVDRL